MCGSNVRWLSKINPKNLANGRGLLYIKKGVREQTPESAEWMHRVFMTEDVKQFS
jgi:hypothetical protein